MSTEKAEAIAPAGKRKAPLERSPSDILFAAIIALFLLALDLYLSIIYYRNTGGYDMRWMLAIIDISVVAAVLSASGKRVFHMLISMRLAVTLLFVVAILAIIGTILPQGQDALLSDISKSPLYHFYSSLGLFDVYHSRWFLALLFTLMTSLVLCISNRLPSTVKKTFRPRVDVKDAFVANQPLAEAFAGAGARGMDVARKVIRGHHYRLYEGKSGSVLAQRGRFAPLASTCFHVSFLLIAIGAIVSTQLGYSEDLAVPDGKVVNVPNTQLQVINYSFKMDYEGKALLNDGSIVAVRQMADSKTVQREDGGDTSQISQVFDQMPTSFISDIQVYKDGKPLGRKSVREGDPLEIDGANFYQKSYDTDPNTGSYVSILEVNHKPLKSLVYAGGILMMGAIMLTLYLPRRRMWFKMDSNGQLLLGGRANRAKLGFQRDFERITKELRLRLGQEARADG